MKEESKPTITGLFVVASLVLGVAFIVTLGGGKLFGSQEVICVTYFEDSLKGLDPGAPVTFKGVKVGEVSSIRLIVAEEGVTAPVIFKLDPDLFYFASENKRQEFLNANQEMLNKSGLNAGLIMQSFVTGKKMIELTKGEPITQVPAYTGSELVMPSRRAELNAMADTLADVPLGDIAKRLASAMEGIDKRVNSSELTKVLQGLSETAENLSTLTADAKAQLKVFGTERKELMGNADELIKNLNTATLDLGKSLETALKAYTELAGTAEGQVSEIGPKVKTAFEGIHESLGSLEKIFEGLQGALGKGSPMYNQLDSVLRDLSRATRSVSELGDYLNRHPDSLLRGKQDN
ncbi:MAG: MlaD family protein [Lentisphaeria bacterium]|nr:MlaD family protein [Lentisphaeria bacterium]